MMISKFEFKSCAHCGHEATEMRGSIPVCWECGLIVDYMAEAEAERQYQNKANDE